MVGLASDAFCDLSAGQIIGLAKKSAVDGIEWGADVHVPAGRVTEAHKVRHGMEKAGLKILSYGSNYRLCENTFPKDVFMAVVMCADMLHTPDIRIWAGDFSPGQAHEHYYERAAKELRVICKMAQFFNITVSLSYHAGTLTQDSAGAIKLIRLADCENLRTCWQPDLQLTLHENKQALQAVLPYLSSVHVFNLSDSQENDSGRQEDYPEWREYIRMVSERKDINFIIESVGNDTPEAFERDAAVLHRLLDDDAQYGFLSGEKAAGDY